MATRIISQGSKAAGALGCNLNHHHVQTVSKSVSLNLLETSEPVTGLYRDCFTLSPVFIQPYGSAV
jgi:hypothetical protein